LNDVRAKAPGRVNLIGEHTDYNGGYMLPTTLPLETSVALKPRSGRTVAARSLDFPSEATAEFEIGREVQRRSWIDYVQGVTWAMRDHADHISGFDLVVTSTLPIGKGLSSSASLEVAVARALNRAFDLEMTDLDIAILCHRAETDFVGAPVGIMDQMVCSLGDLTHALFLDAATLQAEKLPLPEHMEIGVVDSGLSHSHASGEYRTRRRECEEAAALLKVLWLGALTIDDLPRLAHLPPPLDRRARHVVTENARVLASVEALKAGDTAILGRLFLESHASMRDDFEISTPDIDRLVEIAAGDPDVFGARLTGGGFGGAVVIICARGSAQIVTHRTAAEYSKTTERDGRALVPVPQSRRYET
jgi:galactokinase